ncbi:uncharacterized protein LOC107045189 isoform X2 [Diachasma alloeum]|uniref:uncharacterized protein LOC107045189 isoform X2 n=1 Tax=Diachasma alloeum TaxID=454923 RepID=UPI00073832F6|nr:uncharacterized protein LOC107045189 isoform X2 [Diachasma alloeum]
MLEVNKSEDCDWSNGGGRSQRRRVVNQQRVQAHRPTRKGAGIISSRESAKNVTARSFNIFALFTLTSCVIKTHISVIRYIIRCMMGMMGMFKWLRNEAYRNAIQAFIERRKSPSDSNFIVAPNSPDKVRLDFLIKKNYENNKNKNNNREGMMMPGVPHVPAPDIFEIGWVAGTEDRYLELIYAEWHNTRVSLRRHIHPDCKNAVRADLEVLSEIRHPNVLLLMGTTQTEEHGLVAIFEPVDCTLFNYIHEQGERISVQGVAKCAGNLTAALKHAHMRGYIHSAISPHCVFLASTGIVKLGGWELATNVNGPKIFHDYEDRLRSEIFRWQAPELLSGHEASAATDIYSLTLLMWEMCTTNIPWNNLSKTEVERQYLHYRRGVIIDLYNFPPLLNNLLDAGLQLDVTKRTLDMSKLSRYLQRLEMQYEDDEPIYIEQITNNNNKPETPPSCKSPVVTKCTSAESPRRHTRQSVAYQTSANDKPKPPDSIETRDILDEVLKSTSVKNANVITKNMRTDASKNRDLKIRRTSCTAGTNDSPEEAPSDPRVNIKKLKESLASKRETFFYGPDSSNCSPTEKRENLKSKMLRQIRSKDYEPHKPASHKTSLELKLNKSPSQYGTYTKSTNIKTHKPYSYVPTPIRGAIIQPQVLNPDSSSFFETSLWRKEKEICISKMRKSNPGEYQSVYMPNGEINREAKRSPESNETYTINGSNDSENRKTFTITDTSQDMTASSMPRSVSLQALKDALDRATDIVKSTTPNMSTTPVPVSPGSNGSSPFRSPKSFGDDIANSRENESVFEELYKLNEMTDEEIKSIERSASGDTFVVNNKDDKTGKEKSEGKDEKDTDKAQNCANSQRTSAEFSRTLFHCASIAEKSIEQDQSGLEKDWEPETVLHESVTVGERLGGSGPLSVSSSTDKCKGDEQNESNFTLLVFGDKNKEKGCFSCTKGSLARRRSLPAHLGQLRSLSNTPLGKIPIRRIELPDNTVEDIYIDDEFGDSLAVNMVLLNEDEPADDEEFLPDLLELSDGSHECTEYS